MPGPREGADAPRANRRSTTARPRVEAETVTGKRPKNGGSHEMGKADTGSGSGGRKAGGR